MALRAAAIMLIAGAGFACHSTATQQAPIVRPGAPGESSRVLSAGAVASLPQPRFTAADATFMQGMIGHHAQALEMTELLATRTTREDMRKLAGRIEASQADEIKMMQRWLQDRGQALPESHAHHAGALMPGMLTPDEMARLAAASGPEFDRLFLEGMIKHHGGALVMVHDLFATPGAGQESEIFAFASDVDADQRMEIERMASMLKELSK